MKTHTIGVDVGGTNIKFGLVSKTGRIIDRSRLVTKSYSRSKKQLINAFADAIDELLAKNKLKRKDILGIGFGLPGLIDPKKGIVIFLPNIPGWRNVPLRSLVERKLKIPAFLENDVNMIALGEWKFGAGRGHKNILCMTLGTGVGGGLILNNNLYRGEDYVAGELGHVPLNEKGPSCNCGGYGCFEGYVGNSKLMAKARRIFKRKIALEEIYALANKNNRKAIKFWDDAGIHIGNGLVGVVNLLNPRLIVIGGGVSNNLKFMKKAIARTIKNRSMSVQGKVVKIVRAQLGDDAGIIGSQVLVKNAISGQ